MKKYTVKFSIFGKMFSLKNIPANSYHDANMAVIEKIKNNIVFIETLPMEQKDEGFENIKDVFGRMGLNL